MSRASVFIPDSDRAELERLAAERGEKPADTHRTLIRYALAKMPRGWGRILNR